MQAAMDWIKKAVRVVVAKQSGCVGGDASANQAASCTSTERTHRPARRHRPAFCTPILLLLATGCSNVWWRNRLSDLNDVAHVDVTGWSLGAMVNVGPVPAGIYFLVGPDGVGERTCAGLGIWQEERASFGCLLLLGGGEFRKNPRSRWGYGSGRFPPFASVGVDAGLLYGIGTRVDVLEFFDLLLGFVGIDVMDDDKEDPPPDGPPASRHVDAK